MFVCEFRQIELGHEGRPFRNWLLPKAVTCLPREVTPRRGVVVTENCK